jgi:hypothetical protein
MHKQQLSSAKTRLMLRCRNVVKWKNLVNSDTNKNHFSENLKF